jgi:hypothetical protein
MRRPIVLSRSSPRSVPFRNLDDEGMTQQIGRVVVDAVRSSALELFPAVAAREKTHAECAGAARRQKAHTLSPTTTAWAESTPRRLLAAINRSGSGLACWT